jgi:exodeoxyribonuclease-1
MDMYPITLLYYLFKRDHLQWPNNNGVTNLKLENLNACNQFFKGQSHNAMVDVEVTLALARQLFSDQTMWEFVIDYFHKKTDEERIAGNTVGFMVNGKIGAASQFIAPVMHLGQHQHYKNQSLWLRLDESDFSDRGAREEPIKITDYTRVFKKRLGEPPIFLPFKDRYLNLLSNERKNHFANNKKWLENNADILKSIANYYQHEKYPDVPERDIDAALYTIGFPTPAEEKWFQQFHTARPAEKEAIAMRIPNATRREQAIRIIGRHFPEHLSAENKHYFDAYLTSKAVDFRGGKKVTRADALNEIEALMEKELDAEQIKLLEALKVYLN